MRGLYEKGYLKFSDEAGHIIVGEPTAQKLEMVWYQWTPKFYQLLLDQPEKENTALDTTLNAKDTTVEKLED